MPLIPEFGIGLWNGWILSAIFIVVNYLMMFITPKENTKEVMDQVKQAKGKDKLVVVFSYVPYIGIMFYSIFVSLKFGTVWFYVGLTMFTLGMIVLTVAEVQLFFRKPGQLFDKGLYRSSRNPQYVMVYITWTGIGVATMSWVILAFVILAMIVFHFIIRGEEHICLEKYDKSYEDYLKKVPRYFCFFKKEEKMNNETVDYGNWVPKKMFWILLGIV